VEEVEDVEDVEDVEEVAVKIPEFQKQTKKEGSIETAWLPNRQQILAMVKIYHELLAVTHHKQLPTSS
jgi:hypothetical protein